MRADGCCARGRMLCALSGGTGRRVRADAHAHGGEAQWRARRARRRRNHDVVGCHHGGRFALSATAPEKSLVPYSAGSIPDPTGRGTAGAVSAAGAAGPVAGVGPAAGRP